MNNTVEKIRNTSLFVILALWLQGKWPRAFFFILRKIYHKKDRHFFIAKMLAKKDKNSPIYFVQVGAFDGVSGDPLHRYISYHRWNGILVEPQKLYYKKLKKVYKKYSNLHFVRAAVAPQEGEATLYSIKNSESRDLPVWASQIASFDLNLILSHTDQIPNIEGHIQEEVVPTVPLMSLIKKSKFDEIDVVQVDVEGYDFEVLKMINFNKIKPQLIRFEHKHLSKKDQKKAEDMLERKDYTLFENGGDTLAVSESLID